MGHGWIALLLIVGAVFALSACGSQASGGGVRGSRAASHDSSRADEVDLDPAAVAKALRKDLSEFRKYLATIPPAEGQRAEVTPEGQAAVPFNAPPAVATVIQAANEIAKTPYRWGGGHGAWRDKGYDCSGSVSFALAAAGLLDGPLTSGAFLNYGKPGRGKWITLWTNSGHIFMEIAGIRYDTGGLRSGSRWQPTMRPTAGFTPRHPPGL